MRISKFDKRSLLTRIRQKISFHYVDEDGVVESSFQALAGKPHEAYRLFNEQVQGCKAIRDRFDIAGEWSRRELLKDLNTPSASRRA